MSLNHNVLVSENIGGNLHQAASAINQRELADYVLVMDHAHSNTVVVYRMPLRLAQDKFPGRKFGL